MASRPFIIAVLIDAVIPVKTGIQRSGHPLPAFARTGFVGVTLSHLPRAVGCGRATTGPASGGSSCSRRVCDPPALAPTS